MAVRRLVDRTSLDSDYTGLSTDTKPTSGVALNSLFLELDTKTLYYCATASSKSRQTVFDGDIGGTSFLDGVLYVPNGEITVDFDGISYVCQQKTVTIQGEDTMCWGADVTEVEPRLAFDFSEYPFNILAPAQGLYFTYGGTVVGEHLLTITGTVETPAEWVKYGEAPSESGVEGNLKDGLTISPSAWEVDENIASVIVPYYELVVDNQYILYEGGNDWTATASSNNSGVYVEYWDGDLIIISYPNEDRTVIEVATDEVDITETMTLRLLADEDK